MTFHDEMTALKSTTRQKGLAYADTRLSKYTMGPVVPISKPCFEYMVQCQREFRDVTAHITESVSNVKWSQNVFSLMYVHFEML